MGFTIMVHYIQLLNAVEQKRCLFSPIELPFGNAQGKAVLDGRAAHFCVTLFVDEHLSREDDIYP